MVGRPLQQARTLAAADLAAGSVFHDMTLLQAPRQQRLLFDDGVQFVARKRKSTPGPYLLSLEILRDRIPDPTRFPYNLPAVRGLSTLSFHPKVTFLVGENGSGKSTMLEAVAVACGLNPEGGSRNFNFATRPSHSPLDECVRLARALATPADSYFLRAESFYNVASELERLDADDPAAFFQPPKLTPAYGGRSLHEQSHGESFFALFRNRFRGHGLYLIDEPEAALSPTRQLQFLELLHDYVKRGGQFVIATHSPIIMAYPEARIYSLGGEGVQEVTYTDTEHYRVTRGFLSSPQRSLALLLADEAEAERLNGPSCQGAYAERAPFFWVRV
jgi:predicted ATPase